MEKSNQNGDIEGDTSQSLEVAQDGGDLSERVNGEVIRVKKAGACVEEDSVATGQESDEEFSQPEVSRASEYEEEVSVGRANGKVVEEESDQETEDLVSERQNVDVSESTQEVEEIVEAVEEIEVTDRQETLDEVTQGSEEEAEVSERESVDLQEDAGTEKRKIEYVEDLDLEEEEEGEEKQDTESVTEEREEEDQEEEEEEPGVPEEPTQDEDLVDCKPETKENIQSLKTSAKEHKKTRERDVEEFRKLPEGLHRRRSSAESFQKLKDRFSNGTKIEENNRKNIEDEQSQGGAKNMSDKNKRFGGTSEKCTQCNRTVYPMEKMEVAGRLLHKTCFKCCKCNSQLSVGRFSIGGKDMYCMTHYKQAFREKGNYDVFTPDNPIKGKWENK